MISPPTKGIRIKVIDFDGQSAEIDHSSGGFDGFFGEVSGLDAFELGVDFATERLEIVRIFLDDGDFLLHALEGPHGALDFVDEGALLVEEGVGEHLEIVHFAAVHFGDLLFLPALLLLAGHFLLDLELLLLLLLLALDGGDALVEFGQQVRQLRVDFVDQVREVGRGLVVDRLEEHHRREVLLEVLQLLSGDFPLQDVDDVLLLGPLDFLREADHLLLELQDGVDVAADRLHPLRVALHQEGTDDVDFVVGADGDFVNEVADRQLSALRQNVLNVPALDVAAVFDGLQDAPLDGAGPELAPLRLLLRLLEEQNLVVVDQEAHEGQLLVLEERPVLVLELDHLQDFLLVVLHRVVSARAVDHDQHSVADVLEGPEGLVQVADQFGQLVGPGLRNVRLVHHQHQFDLLVDVQQPLHEEGVRDLVLLALVVLEARAVVEGHLLDHHLGRDGGLRVLLVPDFYGGLPQIVQGGLEPVELDHQLGAAQVGHDGALADARVADHDDRLLVRGVLGDGLNARVNQQLELVELYGVRVFVHVQMPKFLYSNALGLIHYNLCQLAKYHSFLISSFISKYAINCQELISMLTTPKPLKKIGPPPLEKLSNKQNRSLNRDQYPQPTRTKTLQPISGVQTNVTTLTDKDRQQIVSSVQATLQIVKKLTFYSPSEETLKNELMKFLSAQGKLSTISDSSQRQCFRTQAQFFIGSPQALNQSYNEDQSQYQYMTAINRGNQALKKNGDAVSPLTKSYIFRVKKANLDKVNSENVQVKIQKAKTKFDAVNQQQDETFEPKTILQKPSNQSADLQEKVKPVPSEVIISKLKKRIKAHLKVIEQLNEKIEQLENQLERIKTNSKEGQSPCMKGQVQAEQQPLLPDFHQKSEFSDSLQKKVKSRSRFYQENSEANITDLTERDQDFEMLKEQLLEREVEIQSLLALLDRLQEEGRTRD